MIAANHHVDTLPNRKSILAAITRERNRTGRSEYWAKYQLAKQWHCKVVDIDRRLQEQRTLAEKKAASVSRDEYWQRARRLKFACEQILHLEGTERTTRMHELAAEFAVPFQKVSSVLGSFKPREDDPTPEEVAERCAAIRQARPRDPQGYRYYPVEIEPLEFGRLD